MNTRRIPLFPLNVVLFPGMPLPLHIFEPRYQQMIRHCLEGDRQFGVCLIRSGEEVGGPADPYSIGSLCEIVNVTEIEGGRVNLLGIGRERFRVRRLFHSQPYLEGEVELFADDPSGQLETLAADVQAAATRFIERILALTGKPTRELEFPGNPIDLSFVIAGLVQGPVEDHQELLETRDTEFRLRRELEVLDRQYSQLPEAPPPRTQVAVRFRATDDRIHLN